jgi:hypothetical protein
MFTFCEKADNMNAAADPLPRSTETQIIEDALNGLHDSTGVVGELVGDGAMGDGEVALHVAGTRLHYQCEVKRNVDRTALLDDIKTRSTSNGNTLLVCTALTPAMAARCHALDLQFIDTAGNAYLTNRQGILINVVGRKPQKGSVIDLDKTITPAALRMMFAFLAQPSMLNAPYREISSSVQVSTGAIGNALAALETRGFIGTTPTGARIINSPERMLSEWATGYLSRIKPKLKKFRFAALDTADLLHGWAPEPGRSAWSGEVAAEKVTKHLNPSTVTIYMEIDDTRDLPEMVKRLKLRGDPNGPIEVVQAFWNMDFFGESFPTVPLHLIYADLLGTNDPRNLLIAKQIHKKVIDHVHGSGE